MLKIATCNFMKNPIFTHVNAFKYLYKHDSTNFIVYVLDSGFQ